MTPSANSVALEAELRSLIMGRKLASVRSASLLLGVMVVLSACSIGGAPQPSVQQDSKEKGGRWELTENQGVKTVSTTEGLVSTDWLESNLEDPNLVVLHVSSQDGLFERGHIPGALKIDWATELAGKEGEDGVVSREDFRNVVQELGINDSSKVILYADDHQLFATWGVWVFKVYGFNNVRLLDGGLTKWKEEGRELTLEVPQPADGDFAPTEPNLQIRAFIDEVVSVASAEEPGNKIIVDNRDYESYSGITESGAKFDGHASSAENLFSFALFSEDTSYIDATEIADAFREIGVTDDKEIILYCGTGLLASASWFALTQILGYENVKNYDASWAEYGNTDDVPIETASGN